MHQMLTVRLILCTLKLVSLFVTLPTIGLKNVDHFTKVWLSQRNKSLKDETNFTVKVFLFFFVHNVSPKNLHDLPFLEYYHLHISYSLILTIENCLHKFLYVDPYFYFCDSSILDLLANEWGSDGKLEPPLCYFFHIHSFIHSHSLL